MIHSDYYICRHTGPRADTELLRTGRLHARSLHVHPAAWVDSLRQDEIDYIDHDPLLVTATFIILSGFFVVAILPNSAVWRTSNSSTSGFMRHREFCIAIRG